jgi:hypothetical protein
MLWCRKRKTASSFALLLASAIIVHHATDAGRIDVDASTLTSTEKSNRVSVSFSFNAETENDLFNMLSLSLPTEVGSTEEAEVVVYTKTEATQRTVENGLVEIAWHGSLSESARFGHATLIQTSDGNVAGILSTETSSFTLKTMPDGTLELEETFWADDFEDSVYEEEYLEESDSLVEGDAEETFTPAMIVDSPISVTSETSWGQGIDVAEGENRSLRDENRSLQQLRRVDVLVLVTNRAMCSAARRSAGCSLDASSRAPIEGMIKVVEEQTNTAMQAVGVRTSVKFVRIVHLNTNYDGRPSSAGLRDLSSSQTVASWRAGAGADLVAMVTGDDPNGLIGGISYLNRPWSVNRYVFGSHKHQWRWTMKSHLR